MAFGNYVVRSFGGKKGLFRLSWFHFMDLFTRRYSRFREIPNDTHRLVFVCKGNICRSALAEHYFRSISPFPTASIGLSTHSGKPANERVLAETKGLDINLSSHRTTAIEDFESLPGDLFVCMEPANIDLLLASLGEIPIVLLGLFGSPRRIYIHDPYNAKLDYLQFCNSYIVNSVDTLNILLLEKTQRSSS